MLFDELVEQHCIHLIVVDTLWLPFRIARYQSWVHLGYFLGNQTKGGRLLGINLLLVAVGDRFESVKPFADVGHRFNVLLVTPRRTAVTEQLRVQVDGDVLNITTRGLDGAANIGDVRVTDLVSYTAYVRANVDVEAARGNVCASAITQGRICSTGVIVQQRINTESRVGTASVIPKQGLVASGRVEVAARIAQKCE